MGEREKTKREKKGFDKEEKFKLENEKIYLKK